MGTWISKWRPSWWTDEVHGSAWDLIKDAVRRDWMQTAHELSIRRYEMNQTLSDTLRQAAAWSEAEIPYGFGYAARTRFGAQHPRWNDGLEQRLKGEWMGSLDSVLYEWEAVRSFVRCGYEFEER
jgi:hypothetical protein